MFKEIFKPALILCLICAVMTGALAYVNGITEGIIAENERLVEQENLSRVLGGADSFSEPIKADDLKNEGYSVSDRIEKVYKAQKDGDTVGYVVAVLSRGYGGDMKILVGIDKEQKITGIILTSHNETPGLGDKVTFSDFTDQYKGGFPEEEFFVVKRETRADSEIQAVTAATKSSRAVTTGVNDALNLVRSMAGGN